MSRLDRLVELRRLLGEVWDAAYAASDLDRGERAIERIRLVSSAITGEVTGA